MEETTFAADPMRLMIAAAVGIVILLILIIKFKLHPVLSMIDRKSTRLNSSHPSSSRMPSSA